jgi:hypothetical protein
VILLCGSVVFYLWPQWWWVDALSCVLLLGFIAMEGKEMLAQSRSGQFTGGCC